MPRGRHSSSSSPSSPSSRSKSRGPSRSKSRAPSRSQSRAPSRGPPLSRHPSSSTEKEPPSPSSGPDLKNSLLFLGTIAAAAFTAHKVWPKGVLYGHKDDWEAEHERREHEGKASSCRKPSHRQVERDRGRDRSRDRPRDRSPPRPRDIETAAPRPTKRDVPFPEVRRSATTAVPPPPPQPQQQRKYLPYEPGVYTPSSVTASSASARAFEHQRRRERPVLLPIEGPRGQPHLPFAPVAPSAVAGRRGGLFEDEGYASRESVPAVRSFAPARYQEGERGEYWR